MLTKENNLLVIKSFPDKIGKMIKYIQMGDRMLDFGCGHQAYLLNHVKDRLKQGVGIDYDSNSHKIAPHIEVLNYHFKSQLPFEKSSFNKIFMLASLEHLAPETADRLFEEFSRVLTEDGKIILTTPTPLGKHILEFMAFRLGVISAEEVADHKKYYGKTDLEEFAHKHGYIINTYKTFQLGGNSLCVLEKKTH
jgi:SAM-dependent methyltransferase